MPGACRIPLPPLDEAAVTEVAVLYVRAGLLPPGQGRRPLRRPDPGIRLAELFGASRTPGEVGLAHRGVFLLDDLRGHERASPAPRWPAEWPRPGRCRPAASERPPQAFRYIRMKGWHKGEPVEPQAEVPELLRTAFDALRDATAETPADLADRLHLRPQILAQVTGLPVPCPT